jgi:hypothetical protein
MVRPSVASTARTVRARPATAAGSTRSSSRADLVGGDDQTSYAWRWSGHQADCHPHDHIVVSHGRPVRAAHPPGYRRGVPVEAARPRSGTWKAWWRQHRGYAPSCDIVLRRSHRLATGGSWLAGRRPIMSRLQVRDDEVLATLLHVRPLRARIRARSRVWCGAMS